MGYHVGHRDQVLRCRARRRAEPGREGLGGEGWQAALRVDAQKALGPPGQGVGHGPVGDRGQPRPHAVHPGDVGEEPCPQGDAVSLVVVAEELVLELGHVHVGGALRLAALAPQAKVHHVMEALASDSFDGQCA